MTIQATARTIFNVLPSPAKPTNVYDAPKRYNVLLHKQGEGQYEFSLGYVVSHLSISDWCQLHKYDLITLYPGTRPAGPNERTDLL